jgi:hypothetical protein
MFMASLTSTKRKASLFRDGLLVFTLSAVASATVGSLAMVYLSDESLADMQADVLFDQDPLDSVRASLGLPAMTAPVGVPIEPDPYIESQVEFVSDIIRSHVSHHIDVDALSNLIINECLRQNYDPILVAAVIRAESMFRHQAVSGAGARGLMQIMPATGRYLSQSENVPWNGSKTLHDPETNLRLGIAYLRQLEERFKGNRERALIAYNWGPGNVEDALRTRRSPPRVSLAYARGIMTAHRTWRQTFMEFAQADTGMQANIG